jgi:hypothetical protein
VIRSLILIACAFAALFFVIAAIDAVRAIITGHATWIELAEISVAASLIAIALGELPDAEP